MLWRRSLAIVGFFVCVVPGLPIFKKGGGGKSRSTHQIVRERAPAGSPTTFFAVGQNYLDEWQAFASACRTPAGISIYTNIFYGNLALEPEALLKAFAASSDGYVLLGLSWKNEMTTFGGYTQFQGAQMCNDISAGKYDSQLSTLAAQMKSYPNVKWLVRVDYEVSENYHANTDPIAFNSATWDLKAYPKAFAHICSALSAENVQFVYHPTRGSAENLYPGDSVVDLFGTSIFNNDVCMAEGGGESYCPDQAIDPNVIKDLDWSPKPMIIAESAVQVPVASSPQDFITYLQRVKDLADKYNFVGWFYINSDWVSHGWPADMWGDSRIDTKPEVKDWFNGNIYGGRFTFGDRQGGSSRDGGGSGGGASQTSSQSSPLTPSPSPAAYSSPAVESPLPTVSPLPATPSSNDESNTDGQNSNSQASGTGVDPNNPSTWGNDPSKWISNAADPSTRGNNPWGAQ